MAAPPSVNDSAPIVEADATVPAAFVKPDKQHQIRLGIPKKGRIYDKTLELLKGCDVKFSRPHRVDVATCTNLPIELVFLPAADIAMYVADGNVDAGITGQDIVAESTGCVEGIVVERLKLGLGKCRLCVQVPEDSGLTDPKQLLGKRCVTSFPNLTNKYFTDIAGTPNHGVKIMVVHGSVEAAIALGLGDCIVDLVETGETMRAAKLMVCSTVMDTQTVFIANPKSDHLDTIQYLQRRIEGYLTAKSFSFMAYNVAKEDLDKCLQITPGKRSPTVATLENGLWVAVSVLVETSKIQSIMDELELAGATDMLIFDLKNTRGI